MISFVLLPFVLIKLLFIKTPVPSFFIGFQDSFHCLPAFFLYLKLFSLFPEEKLLKLAVSIIF
jgi:hypothetical protein